MPELQKSVISSRGTADGAHEVASVTHGQESIAEMCAMWDLLGSHGAGHWHSGIASQGAGGCKWGWADPPQPPPSHVYVCGGLIPSLLGYKGQGKQLSCWLAVSSPRGQNVGLLRWGLVLHPRALGELLPVARHACRTHHPHPACVGLGCLCLLHGGANNAGKAAPLPLVGNFLRLIQKCQPCPMG